MERKRNVLVSEANEPMREAPLIRQKLTFYAIKKFSIKQKYYSE